MNKKFSLYGKRIYVAGHSGLVGNALVQALKKHDCDILTIGHSQLDLTRQSDTEDWMADRKPDVVVIAAALVGGIQANQSRPAEFIYENLAIQTNLIHAAHKAKVRKLLFIGSNCAYPTNAVQPLQEGALFTGALEPTNEFYAMAKLAGIKLCEAYRRQYGDDFISVIPTNLYGPGDNFNPKQCHVIPAQILKAHAAKDMKQENIEVWGSGTPIREFMYIEDLAEALIFLLENYSEEAPVNVGTGEIVTISELVKKICDIVGFEGSLAFDRSKPDGMMRKTLDCSCFLAMGWKPAVSLEEGLKKTYLWYQENILTL